jgi:predicted nucleotidyltransferase
VDPAARLADRLSRIEHVRFGLLFGSRAAGRADSGSDWDVAVYLSPELTPRQRLDARLQLIADLEEVGPVDVVILNDAPPLVAQRALQGRRLLTRDASAYVRYFVKTLAAAGDEVPWRHLHRHARQSRLQEGSFGRP